MTTFQPTNQPTVKEICLHRVHRGKFSIRTLLYTTAFINDCLFSTTLIQLFGGPSCLSKVLLVPGRLQKCLLFESNTVKSQSSWSMRRQSLRYDDICPRQLTETKKKQLDQETHLQTTILGGSMFYFQVFSLGCSLYNHDLRSCQLHRSDRLHRAESYAIPRLEKLLDLEVSY